MSYNYLCIIVLHKFNLDIILLYVGIMNLFTKVVKQMQITAANIIIDIISLKHTNVMVQDDRSLIIFCYQLIL